MSELARIGCDFKQAGWTQPRKIHELGDHLVRVPRLNHQDIASSERRGAGEPKRNLASVLEVSFCSQSAVCEHRCKSHRLTFDCSKWCLQTFECLHQLGALLSNYLNFVNGRQHVLQVLNARLKQHWTHRRELELQIRPQLAKPRVELTFEPEVVLVVSKSNLMEERGPQIEKSLSQFLGHFIEEGVR